LQANEDFSVVGVLVRDVERERGFARWAELVTVDHGVIDGADVVVEVMGGVTTAADLSLKALAAGSTLVTANKAALAERWDEFWPYLSRGKVYLEASVMAGVPVVGALTGPLRGCAPVALRAVLNGTCNVILSAMEQGAEYADALADAQERGYAEADPSLDVGGFDAAHKLSVLARLAFAPELDHQAVRSRTTGIEGVTADMVREHAARGRSIRLVGSVGWSGGAWSASVEPVSLPRDHPLVTEGPINTMLFSGDPLGDVLLRGPGAGGGATASAVVGDVVASARGVPGHVPVLRAAARPAGHAGDADSESLVTP
jgi:homoserine dehydrogenase